MNFLENVWYGLLGASHAQCKNGFDARFMTLDLARVVRLQTVMFISLETRRS